MPLAAFERAHQAQAHQARSLSKRINYFIASNMWRCAKRFLVRYWCLVIFKMVNPLRTRGDSPPLVAAATQSTANEKQ